MSPRSTFVGIVAAAALVASTGCAELTANLDEGPREYVATDYEAVLRNWTRSEQLFVLSRLDAPLTVTATFESWDFRWAYVVRYAEDYRLTIDQRRDLLERSLAETRLSHQFYVALYTQDDKWADLDAEDAAWIVRLVDDSGSETAPSEIDSIRRPGAIERTYFPYTSPWRKAFRIRFPTTRADGRPTIAPDATWFGLRFAGAPGNQLLHWATVPGAEPETATRTRGSRAVAVR